MDKICPICDYALKDQDDVVAIMVAKFKMLPSDVNYAIEHPTKCIELVHNECFDWAEYGDEERDGD